MLRFIYLNTELVNVLLLVGLMPQSWKPSLGHARSTILSGSVISDARKCLWSMEHTPYIWFQNVQRPGRVSGANDPEYPDPNVNGIGRKNVELQDNVMSALPKCRRHYHFSCCKVCVIINIVGKQSVTI